LILAGMVNLVSLTACSSDEDPVDATNAAVSTTTGESVDPSVEIGGSSPATGRLGVVASFYPLQFVAEVVGSDRVSVTNLTPPGAEPHELELTGDDTASLQDADLVVFLAGFMPALDDAIQNVAGDHSIDVAGAARLDLADAHFWLDPDRLADVADAIAARLSELDAAGAATYQQNAATLRVRLEELDSEFEAGLANCSTTDIVTSHEAFAYLAARYGLTQIGISGLAPDEEPTPADLADVAQFVTDNDVHTIYYETLVDPSVAETVAAETGATTAVLDPIEGITSDSHGADYFAIMRSNLSNLRSGQGCT